MVTTRARYKRFLGTDRVSFCPDGWLVGAHCNLGVLEWSPEYHPAELLQHEAQRSLAIPGTTILTAYRHRRFLNAALLAHFLSDSALYPDEWKLDSDGGPRFVTYFGTELYRNKDRPWIFSSYWDEDTNSVGWSLVDLSEKAHGKRTYAAVLKQLSREREGAVG